MIILLFFTCMYYCINIFLLLHIQFVLTCLPNLCIEQKPWVPKSPEFLGPQGPISLVICSPPVPISLGIWRRGSPNWGVPISRGHRFSVKNRYGWSVAAAVTMHYKTGPASLATPTSSYRVALWIVVARVSPYRARTAHQRKQLSRVVTVILSTVVGFFSYVTVVEELQPTSILKFHRWTVFWKPRYRCFYTGSIRCYVLNKLDASSNGIYAL